MLLVKRKDTGMADKKKSALAYTKHFRSRLPDIHISVVATQKLKVFIGEYQASKLLNISEKVQQMEKFL